MIPFLPRSIPVLAVLLAVTPAAAGLQETVTVPPSFENVCATAFPQPFPFATAPTFNVPHRHQQVYDAIVFLPAVGEGEVLRITEIRFRIDEFSGSSAAIVYDNIQANLSTTLREVNALATGSTLDLDSNLGADQTAVFSGNLMWDACGPDTDCPTDVCGEGGDFSTTPFDQTMMLTTAFEYDPTLGNLLLEVYSADGSSPVQVFDAVGQLTSPVTSRVREVINPPDPTHLFPTNANDVGLVTQFVVTVPEPGATATAAAALLALVAARRARMSRC